MYGTLWQQPTLCFRRPHRLRSPLRWELQVGPVVLRFTPSLDIWAFLRSISPSCVRRFIEHAPDADVTRI